MIAAEAAFFDGDHCAHVAARDEHARLARKEREAAQVMRLRALSPLRSAASQRDAGHLPLFVAGNEPRLL